MAYEKNVWTRGDLITAVKLNHIEDGIKDLSKTKADIDGVYPKLVAGDLVESEVKDDVFTYQVTDHTGKANINSIKGNTLNWNQLAKPKFDNYSAVRHGITYSCGTTTEYILTGTSTYTEGDANFYNPVADIQFISGHKYLLYSSSKIFQLYGYGLVATPVGNTSSIITALSSGAESFSLRPVNDNLIASGTVINDKASLCVFDLTQMFGAGNEPTSVAEFTKLYPLPYYQYNAGELLSFNGTGIKTIGKNKVLKILEHANIGSDGKITAVNDYSLAVAEITKGYTYRAWFNGMSGGATTILAGLYTEEPVIGSVAYDGQRQLGFPRTFTAEIDGYIAFRFDYGVTEAQVELGTVTTDYEPYKASSLSLPIAQYFPNGMRSAGSVYDELTPSKAVTRIGAVDLGSLTWYSAGTNGSEMRMYTDGINDVVKPSTSTNTKGNLVCAKYVNDTGDATYTKNTCIAVIQTGRIFVYDPNYNTSSSPSAFKTAMSGVYLYYELATETETDVDLDLSYNTYEGGTEQLLPVNTDVPVTSPISMNVEFDFGENLNARLNKMLSCFAQVETSPSTHNYSVGQYLMYEYQLYKVTSAITTGQSLTVGTNIVATTVMSELLSLTA
jgi:hypothetical protein